MELFKKAMLIFFIIALSFTAGGLSLRAFSQEKADFSRVSLSSHDGILNFFDSSTGSVYMYSEGTGRLLATYRMEKLGKNLDRIEERKAIVYQKAGRPKRSIACTQAGGPR